MTRIWLDATVDDADDEAVDVEPPPPAPTYRARKAAGARRRRSLPVLKEQRAAARSPNPAHLKANPPDVISNLIDSFNVIATPDGSETRSIGPASTKSTPAVGYRKWGDEVYAEQAVEDEEDIGEIDESAAFPVIATARPPSGLSPITNPKLQQHRSGSLKGYLRSRSGSQQSLQSTSDNGRSSLSIDGVDISRGLRRTSNNSLRSLNSLHAKATAQGQRGLAYVTSRERLRSKETDSKRFGLNDIPSAPASPTDDAAPPPPSPRRHFIVSPIDEEPAIAGPSRLGDAYSYIEPGSPLLPVRAPLRESSRAHKGKEPKGKEPAVDLDVTKPRDKGKKPAFIEVNGAGSDKSKSTGTLSTSPARSSPGKSPRRTSPAGIVPERVSSLRNFSPPKKKDRHKHSRKRNNSLPAPEIDRKEPLLDMQKQFSISDLNESETTKRIRELKAQKEQREKESQLSREVQLEASRILDAPEVQRSDQRKERKDSNRLTYPQAKPRSAEAQSAESGAAEPATPSKATVSMIHSNGAPRAPGPRTSSASPNDKTDSSQQKKLPATERSKRVNGAAKASAPEAKDKELPLPIDYPFVLRQLEKGSRPGSRPSSSHSTAPKASAVLDSKRPRSLSVVGARSAQSTRRTATKSLGGDYSGPSPLSTKSNASEKATSHAKFVSLDKPLPLDKAATTVTVENAKSPPADKSKSHDKHSSQSRFTSFELSTSLDRSRELVTDSSSPPPLTPQKLSEEGDSVLPKKSGSKKKKRWSHPDLPIRAERQHNAKVAEGMAVKAPVVKAPEPVPEDREVQHTQPSQPARDSIELEVDQFLGSTRLSQKIQHPQTGRTVAFSEVGDPKGYAVVCCVGMGLTRFVTAFYDELARTLKLRLITPDRPGVGESQPDPSGTPLSWADDVMAILESLGIEKFSLLAHSAGAIYALATALRIPSNIRGRVHLLAPWIPPSQLSPMVTAGTQEQPPAGGQLPRAQRILRALPTPFLKVANSGLLGSSASLGKNDATTPPRNKKKTTSAAPSPAANGNAEMSPPPKPTPPPKQALPPNPRRESFMLMDQVQPQGSALSLARTNTADQRERNEVQALADEERRRLYDAQLTMSIWELATTNANPAVDLLVCLERTRNIGFRYVDVNRAVMIHHGSKDTRVPVENVKWLGRTMRKCEVRILDGEGHGLMASASVMGNVLLEVANEWEEWMRVVRGKSGPRRM